LAAFAARRIHLNIMKKYKFVVPFAGIIAFAALPVFGRTAADYANQAIEQLKAKNYKESERLFGGLTGGPRRSGKSGPDESALKGSERRIGEALT
jgi:hypothetical protein